MASGRKATVPRKAHDTKTGTATLRSKLTVRIVELLYPLPANDYTEPYVREIANKWIYLFYQPGQSGAATLTEEIYADEEGWIRMLKPGTAQDREDEDNFAPYPYPKGYIGIPDKDAHYAFFLSPVQLGPKTLGNMNQAANFPAGGSRWAPSQLAPTSLKLGSYSRYYTTSGSPDIDSLFTLHSYAQMKDHFLYVVLVPDPFAWAEDIQIIAYQGALDIFDRHLVKIRKEVYIAQTFKGVMEVEDDTLGLGNEFANQTDWWNSDDRSTPPKYILRRQHPDESWRTINDSAEADGDKWSELRNHAKTLPDLRIAMYDMEFETLAALGYKYAAELAKWMSASRHKTVEQSCLELEGEPLSLGIVHWAKATVRLGEMAPGQKFLLDIYKDEASRLVKMLLDKAEPQSPGEWWKEKGSPVAAVALSTYKLVENFIGAIHVTDGAKFGKTVQRILGMKVFGFYWEEPEFDRFPKIWGKRKPISIHTLKLAVPAKSGLADSKHFFEKHHVKAWFTGIGLGLSAINWCLTLREVMEGKTTTSEKLKFAFETAGLGMEISKFKLEITLGEEAEKDVAVKGLSKAGALVGVATGFVDFWVATEGAGKAFYMDHNYGVTAAQALAATSAAIGITAGIFGLLFGEAVAGPVGWIALGATLLGLLAAWLTRKLTRNKWEEVAYYSYLGAGHIAGKGDDFYRGFFGNTNGVGFGKSLDKQISSITGLMSAFSLTTESYRDALLGKIRIHPGWVDESTVFHFIWQRGYGYPYPKQWVVVEAELAVSDFEFVKDPKISFYEFGDLKQGKIEWEKRVVEGGETGAKYFEIYPELVNSLYTHSHPFVTTVLAQVKPLGSAGLLEIPFDTEFEISGGPAKRTYQNWVGYSTGSANKQVEINLQGT
jgi:hypothetical protein